MFTVDTPTHTWRKLYTAALREKEKQFIPWRIHRAEEALIARGRALFPATGEDDEEVQAIEDALFALRALRSCVRFRTAA